MSNDVQIQQPQSALYAEYKELQQSLKDKLSKHSTTVFALHELNCALLQSFCAVTIKLISQGLDFAVIKKIDLRTWDTLKYVIELQNKVKCIGPDPDAEIRAFFGTLIEFLKSIVRSVNEVGNPGKLALENKHRSFLANFYCYVGELYEYLGKRSNEGRDFEMAAALYNKAKAIYPYQGKFHFLEATIMIHFQDSFAAVYCLLKAQMSQLQYNCKESLQEVYHQNRAHFKQWAVALRVSPEVDRDTYLKALLIYLIRFNSIILTRIGFEELPQMIGMFEILKEYLQIIRTNVHEDHDIQHELLMKVIQITNFGLHYSLSSSKQIETVSDIRENDIVRESIKYVYGIYVNILDFVLKYLIQGSQKNLDASALKASTTYIHLVIPVIYYLFDQPLVSNYLLTEYPNLNDKLAQIYWFARQNLQRAETQLSGDLFAIQSKLNEEFHMFIYEFEVPLVGLTLYTHVLNTLKKEFTLASHEHETCILYYVCEQLIQQLHGVKIGNAQHIPEQWPEEVRKVMSKQLIILDGMNVAMRFGQECRNEPRFCALGLKVALEYWVKRGHDVHILLPDYCYSAEQVEKKKLMNKMPNKLPDDVGMLMELKAKGFASGIPNWDYDDSYMIEFGRQKGGFILTNDRYNDHIRSLDSKIVEREKLKEWIRNNCISYTFIHDELIPNPDFLKNL